MAHGRLGLEGERTALVLSAGGLFAAYQAGAWKTLSKRLRPDAVIGTSAGALNAWMIASGCPPEEIVEQWRDASTLRLIRARRSIKAWRGLLDPAPLRDAAVRLVARFKPEIPVYVVALELPRLRPRVFEGREITADHLLASCAVAGGFPPVRIGSRYYTDGGLLTRLPLWVAAKTGANRAIGIDVLAGAMPLWIRAPVMLARVAARAPRGHRGLRADVLAPDPPLGPARKAIAASAADIAEWISRGERDAETYMH